MPNVNQNNVIPRLRRAGHTDEQIIDLIGGVIIGTPPIIATFNDGADTITISFDLTNASFTEAVRDTIGATLTNGGGLTWTYNDGADTISAVVSISSSSITDFTEAVQDVVGGFFTDSSTIDFTYNDAGNSISAGVIQSGIDHGSISGLGDDDHTQYHTDARALTWLGTRSTTDLPEGTNLYFTNERAQDAVGGILANGGGLTWTYNDAGNTISAVVSIASSAVTDFAEAVSDTVGAMVTGNTETGIAVTYQDADNTLDFVLDTEYIQDLVGAMFSSNTETGVTVTYQDVDGTIDVEVSTALQQLNNLGDPNADRIVFWDDSAGSFAYLTAGTGLSLSGTTLALDASGNWTGTFDGQEGTYYLARANHTGTQLASTISDFTEAVQDIMGAILADSATIDWTYNDGANTLSAVVIQSGIDHGSIGGLGDDDHPQYGAIAQSETISGSWNFTHSGGLLIGGDVALIRAAANLLRSPDTIEMHRQGFPQSVSSTAGWYNLGNISGTLGQRFRITLLGANGYGHGTTASGICEIVGSFANNSNASVANIQGYFWCLGGLKICDAVKFVEISRTSYDVIVDMNTFSQHGVLVDTGGPNGAVWVSATVVNGSTVSDPGADSATVAAAVEQFSIRAPAVFQSTVSIGSDTLAEYIADTVGAMVSSNTETGISVTYDDADNTLDFVVSITSALVTDFVEAAQDAVGAILTNGGGLTWTYNDAGNTISAVVSITSASVTDFSEAVDDRVAALIQNGTGITWSYNDVANTLTPTVTITQYTDEMAQDAVATMIQNGTGITWSYNDVANTLTPTVTITQYTDELAQDAIGAALTDSSTIDFTYNDAGNTITAAVIADSIGNTLLSNMAQATIKGRAAAAGTGDPTDLTAAQVVTILLTADGAGSLLDSDLLDGQQGSYYLARGNHTGTQTASTISDFAEAVSDQLGTMITGNTETGIAVTYDDTDNTLDFVVDFTHANNAEVIRDVIGTALVEGTGIDLTVNDVGDTIIITADLSELSTSTLPEGTNLYYTDERVDDRVAALIQNGTGITWSYNDVSGTLTPTVTITQYTDEMARDAIGAALTEGAGIDLAINDGADTITITVDLSELSTSTLPEGSNLYYTDERVDDRVATLLVAGTNTTLTYNDVAGTLTIDSSGGGSTLKCEYVDEDLTIADNTMIVGSSPLILTGTSTLIIEGTGRLTLI